MDIKMSAGEAPRTFFNIWRYRLCGSGIRSVLRGESIAQEIVVEGTGDGCSEARTMEKAPSEKERLKAAELLGKRYALFTDKVETDVDMDLNITIDYGEDDTG